MKKLYFICTLLILHLAILVSYAQYPPPTITSFTPTYGPVGTTVKIIGTYFTGTLPNTIVFFGAAKATVTAVSSNTVTVTVPAGANYDYISVTDISYPATAYSSKPFIVTFPCGGLINTSSFAAKSDFTAGSAPFGIATGDLDGDGKVDIAVVNASSNTISVFRNTSTAGTISFAAKVDYTTGAYPQGIAIGDVNADGKKDIIAVNYTPSSISVFKNTCTVGTISFAAKVDFTTGSHPYSAAIYDLDADGMPEIAVANRDGPSVSVFANTSTGATISFAAKVDFTTGLGPEFVAIGDIDGDGKPDIATANSNDNSISILRHTGTVTSLTFATNVDFPAGTAPRCIAIGDLDADGKPDLVTANTNANPGSISVFKNTSTSGTISCATNVDYPTSTGLAMTQGVAIGDVDGDGLPDIVSANAHPAVTKTAVFKNTGTGFAARVEFTTGSYPYNVVIADFDNDGKADLATSNNSGTSISTFRNTINITPAMTNSSTVTICSGDTVNLPLTSNVTSTYIWKAANNTNTSGESITNQTNDSILDVITNNTASVQTVSYTVTPTSVSGCAGTPQTITVTVNPLPVASFSGFASTYCINAGPQILTGSPAGGTFAGSGISTNTFTPSVAGVGSHTVTYTYTNVNGCTNSLNHTTQVAPLPITPAICLVTVDSLSKDNIIVWDKTSYVHGDTFLVYRDTANNNYALIGKVPFDSLSLFTDTVHTLYTANGDPNVSSWRYKIAVQDTCGNISAKSPYHQTIFNQNNGGNFNWSHYQIEGQPVPVPALSNYLFQRDNISNGIYATIQTLSASSTLYTDPSYATYQNTATWRVTTTWTISCTATIINPKDPYINVTNLNSSRSNVYKTNNPTSVNSWADENPVSVLPNPSDGMFEVQWITANGNASIEIYNVFGEKIYSNSVQASSLSPSSTHSQINLSEAPGGIYFLQLRTNEGSVMKKLIKE